MIHRINPAQSPSGDPPLFPIHMSEKSGRPEQTQRDGLEGRVNRTEVVASWRADRKTGPQTAAAPKDAPPRPCASQAAGGRCTALRLPAGYTTTNLAEARPIPRVQTAGG